MERDSQDFMAVMVTLGAQDQGVTKAILGHLERLANQESQLKVNLGSLELRDLLEIMECQDIKEKQEHLDYQD